MIAGSPFARLIDLAKEPTSEKRRELLREVTDLFFDTRNTRSGRESVLMGEVLQTVASSMQDGVLKELAERFAEAPDAPIALMRDLANRSFQVAAPVLRQSPVLTDADLVKVITHRSQDHIRAVAQRQTVSETVTTAIVKIGDDAALGALLQNEGAQFTRASMEEVVDRARESAALHDYVVGCAQVPIDLLNEMLFLVEQRLRGEILKRNERLDPGTVDAALAAARRRLQEAGSASRSDRLEAQHDIAAMVRERTLDAKALVGFHRDKKVQHFILGLAELTGIDAETANGIVIRHDIDALATVCRAAGIDRALFVTLAVLTCGGERSLTRAEEFGRLYLSVPMEAAQRALRFFRIRKASEGGAVAA